MLLSKIKYYLFCNFKIFFRSFRMFYLHFEGLCKLVFIAISNIQICNIWTVNSKQHSKLQMKDGDERWKIYSCIIVFRKRIKICAQMWMKVLDFLFNAKRMNFLACWWLHHVLPFLSAILCFFWWFPSIQTTNYHLIMKIHQNRKLYHLVSRITYYYLYARLYVSLRSAQRIQPCEKGSLFPFSFSRSSFNVIDFVSPQPSILNILQCIPNHDNLWRSEKKN